jgi:transposase
VKWGAVAKRDGSPIAAARPAAAIISRPRSAHRFSTRGNSGQLGICARRVPSEHTSGPKRRIGGITKAGDIHARTLLIEAAHSYRYPARIARHKLAVVDAVPDTVRDIAWKAQTRLCQRYRHMQAAVRPRGILANQGGIGRKEPDGMIAQHHSSG